MPRHGEGGVLVVEGPPGAGVSTLLGQARRVARERGVAVRRARAGELERGFAFGIVRQLLEPELDPVPADDSPAALAEVAAAVARLARERPLLLAVDDLQWADGPSVRALEFLAARVDDLPVLLVLGLRAGEDAGLGGLPARAADTLRPAPLTEAAVGRVIAADAAVVAAAWHTTGGNPALVAALAHELAAAGAVEPEDVESLGARAVAGPVRVRLSRVPPGAARSPARRPCSACTPSWATRPRWPGSRTAGRRPRRSPRRASSTAPARSPSSIPSCAPACSTT